MIPSKKEGTDDIGHIEISFITYVFARKKIGMINVS